MKKGQTFEGVVERIEFPNKGIVQVEDRKVIVKNTVEGQTVSFLVNKIRKGKAEGRLLEVVEKAPKEIDSACPHFGNCGGCTYQNLSYEDQLTLKETQVHEMLDQVFINRGEKPAEQYVFEGIKGSPDQFAYRNKMEFSFGDEYKDGPLSLGMHKRGSFYDIVTVNDCKIVEKDYQLILETVLSYFQEKNASFYHRLRHVGYLRHLLVRRAQKTGEILIALITSTQEEYDLTGLVDALLALEKNRELTGKIVGILHTKNDSLADVVQSDETITLYGQEYFYEEILGLRFKISQFSFFQTNSLGAEVLYETVRGYVGNLADTELKEETSEETSENKGQIVFDLYSGTGTIAQMLAPVAKKVVGVEIIEEAVEAAKINAGLNGLDNCEFIAGDVLKVLDDVKDKPDFIVLDPPRDGIHPKAITKIINYGVERIVYISCKPTSLMRDLEIFLENGYKVEKAVCVDMFPGTVHVETVVLLQKQ